MKLGQIKYAGDIRAYLTEFRALNNYSRATGEGLQEKIDLAIRTDILQMRFSHYLGEFADDKGFLKVTYQVGLQVERRKALEKAREASKSGKVDGKEKEGQGTGKGSGRGRSGPAASEKETEKAGLSGSGREPTLRCRRERAPSGVASSTP